MKARGLFTFVLREARGARGRLAFFGACITIGVAAVVGVASLSSALDEGMRSRSRELLAADIAVSARKELPPELDAFLGTQGDIERTRVRELATMAALEIDGEPGGARLVELKVVEGRYPFYGQLGLEPTADSLADLLTPESAVVAPELLTALEAKVGDRIFLGGALFRIAAAVTDEPSRLEFSMTLGPRVLLSGEGLARSALLGVGNRVRHTLLLKLQPGSGASELAAFKEALEAKLGNSSGISIETHTEAQPGIRRGLERFGRFLGLVALLSLLLGGIGVAQVVRTWLAASVRDIAVLRSLGLRPREVLLLYLTQVLGLALVGSFVGALLGSLMPLALGQIAPDLAPPDLISGFQPVAFARGLGLGIAIALLFSLPPLTAVWRVSPALVLRAEAAPLPAPRLVRYGSLLVLVAGIFGSAWLQGGDVQVAAVFAGGLLALGLVLAGGACLVIYCVRRIPRAHLSPHLVQGLTALTRTGAGTVGAIVALGLGVLVVASMALIESRLERELSGTLPDDAPSSFLVDIQPDQWDGVRELLENSGAESIDSTPVVMARIASIDGRDVDDIVANLEERRERWVFTREQRLTWGEALPDGNRLVEGALWEQEGVDEASIEVDFAADLGVGIGSQIVFDVQGVPVEVTVTSLREVEWESFAINFFLLVEPGVLDHAPQFRIAAARLDEAEEDRVEKTLVSDYGNVTLLRLRPILTRIAEFLGRLSLAIRGLGSFTILAGIAILAGAVSATQVRRAREVALWKTLGITRRGVATLMGIEFLLTGLVAGALGGLGAQLLAWSFLEHVVELPAELPWASPFLAAIGAALLSLLAGLAASARALAVRPLETLRG
ncbi:MAG: putative ABC transport system permease protein [Chlamydiales bacterium]|jgi:putative ABC transport system permease protein